MSLADDMLRPLSDAVQRGELKNPAAINAVHPLRQEMQLLANIINQSNGLGADIATEQTPNNGNVCLMHIYEKQKAGERAPVFIIYHCADSNHLMYISAPTVGWESGLSARRLKSSGNSWLNKKFNFQNDDWGSAIIARNSADLAMAFQAHVNKYKWANDAAPKTQPNIKIPLGQAKAALEAALEQSYEELGIGGEGMPDARMAVIEDKLPIVKTYQPGQDRRAFAGQAIWAEEKRCLQAKLPLWLRVKIALKLARDKSWQQVEQIARQEDRLVLRLEAIHTGLEMKNLLQPAANGVAESRSTALGKAISLLHELETYGLAADSMIELPQNYLEQPSRILGMLRSNLREHIITSSSQIAAGIDAELAEENAPASVPIPTIETPQLQARP